MRLEAALTGDLGRMMAAEIKAAEQAVTTGMRAATDGLKTELRSQITDAGLGARLARTWRGETFPKGRTSIAAAGFVWSKAPGIVRVYEEGAVIRSTKGFFLAIPTEAAGKFGDGAEKITPGGWERRNGQRLRFIFRRGAPSLLVADLRARTGKRGGFGRASATALRTGRGLTTVPIFILVPQVSLKKRLDVAGAAARWQARLPGLVVRNWRDPQGE
ncbi:hypothetical protein GCM10007972_24810 [Iodidimonas muriae]|uniref:Uncharacterized protein n=1 Tax=Iodidimonas muriae TaxID=261467 RepID=A0ABQ2LG22_9PROT|nr:DUF6441 family protein [Iodidimonas muriae]GGO16124.1 hypothetical protein GCM10007972_24810 [Iodidimonas muriae]